MMLVKWKQPAKYGKSKNGGQWAGKDQAEVRSGISKGEGHRKTM